MIDAHCHIGEIPPWKFYDLEHPVKPTVYDYKDTKTFVAKHMDEFKVERALAMSNYGVPIHDLVFDLNDVTMDAATSNDRILAAITVSFLPRNAERTREALKLAAESRVGRAQDHVPARRQPRSEHLGRRDRSDRQRVLRRRPRSTI